MKKFYTLKNKKVFLTGHTGFKGSWMLCLLQLLGAKVKGYALPSASNSLYSLIGGDQLCESIFGDIRDFSKVNHEIKKFEPDFIFHFAAQPLVLNAYEDPKYTFDVNIGGSVNVLESFRQIEKRSVLLCSTTDKVYKNKNTKTPYKESDELGGRDPYSSSKVAMEAIIQSYFSSFAKHALPEKGIVTARAGNVIGGGDISKNRIIPDIVRSVLRKETLIVRNPEAIRPWQHVLDALVGYLIAAIRAFSHPALYSKAYNFGPDMKECITVKKLIEIAFDTFGKCELGLQKSNANKLEADYLLLDSSYAHKMLSWYPVWNGKQAIKKTMEWHKGIEKGQSALDLCQNDIKCYFSLTS